jgi:hypothetical protein
MRCMAPLRPFIEAVRSKHGQKPPAQVCSWQLAYGEQAFIHGCENCEIRWQAWQHAIPPCGPKIFLLLPFTPSYWSPSSRYHQLRCLRWRVAGDVPATPPPSDGQVCANPREEATSVDNCHYHAPAADVPRPRATGLLEVMQKGYHPD